MEGRVDADVFEPQEGVVVAVIDAQAASESADPQAVLVIFDDGFDLVVCYGPWVCRVVAVDGERITVVAVEPVLGAEP